MKASLPCNHNPTGLKRGGATRSDVILSHKAIYCPKVEQPNILVALTDAACAKYLPLIRPGGLCIYDTELVHPGRKVEAQFKGLPLWGAVSGTPRFGGFVQRGRARSARDADRSGAHRLDRDGAGGTFPGGTPRGQFAGPASWRRACEPLID